MPLQHQVSATVDSLIRVADALYSVSPTPGKSTGLEVLVQGKQVKVVTEFLASRGVPKKWMETADLSGGGKK